MARPTGYDPRFCDGARDFIAQGFSLTAFAGHLGVSRQTVYNWADQYPEFLDAVKSGQAGGVLWWERRNKEFAETGEGNATAIIFGLKNRASDEWRDITRNEHTGADGGPIQTQQVETDAEAFRSRLIQGAAAATADEGTGEASA